MMENTNTTLEDCAFELITKLVKECLCRNDSELSKESLALKKRIKENIALWDNMYKDFLNNGKSKTLHIKANVRYWEDAYVNGETENDESPTIPGVNSEKDAIEWDIDVETGKILNWNIGTTAKTFYKICDEFEYDYDDFHYGPDYVPDFMGIDDKGYGDYMYVTVDENGIIKNWKFNRFEKEHKEIVKNG